jgi:hypothetical protein
MSAHSDDSLSGLKTTVLEGMKAYLREVDVAYTESDVQRCGEILDELKAAIERSGGRDEALSHVRTAVLDLNALNNRCEGSLIETDQREMICAFIIKTTAGRGFISPEEDVTFEWREW